MKTKLKPCSACGNQIARSATACPHCGKKYSSPVGLILAVIIGVAVGWLMIAKTCSQTSEADERMDEIQDQLKAR